MEKGEIAHFEQFHLFPQCFPMVIKALKDTDCIENIVGKGEIAHFERFHLFPQSFPKAFSSMC